MASRVTEPASGDAASEELPLTSDTSATNIKPAGRSIVPIAAGALTLVCAIALLFPVVAAPVHADDRYWYLMIGPHADGSLINIIQWSWDNIAVEVQSGRLATLAAVERRIVGMGIIEASVATATPIVVFLALAKLLLVGLGVLTVLAFVKALRWRTQDGELVGASRRTIFLVGIATTLAIAVGAQAHSQFRNGWTSYAVLTYGAVVFIFGSIAFLLWTTRLVAERWSRGIAVVAAISLVVLAGITNISYEIVYPAVPIAVLALLVVPITDRANCRRGIQAKLITASIYLGAFTAVFLGVRWYINRICGDNECYAGVSPRLGLGALRTAFYNLVTAVPGAADNEIRADLRRVGWGDLYPVLPTAWSVIIGLMGFGALLLAWYSTHRSSVPRSSFAGMSHDLVDRRRAEAALLAIGAGLAVVIALSTAAIMGVSVQAQEIILQPGLPYRNTMVTWSALAVAAVLGIRSLGLMLPKPAGLVTWAALASAIAIMAALLLPSNMMLLRAYRALPGIAVTESINWEVVLGDMAPESDQRRCEDFEQLAETMSDDWTRNTIYRNANTAFWHYHGRPFCSDPSYPGYER